MNRASTRVPPPPEALSWSTRDLVRRESELYRIYRAGGPHPAKWNDFRQYGPVATCRWDPHPEPAGIHQDFAVMYCAASLATALAEVFQDSKIVTTSSGDLPRLTIWEPTRPLVLLNLDSLWPIRSGAAHSLNSLADLDLSRQWARAISLSDNAKELDGLRVQSTWTGEEMVVLFASAQSALPVSPEVDTSLNADGIRSFVQSAAEEIHFGFSN